MVHKTCGYGDCRSDSRKENLDNVTFISFPRDTGKNHEKCLRWITLSGRIDLTPERVNRYTYVCSKHFVGGNGPTDEYPDPVQFPGKISRIPRGIHGNMRVAPHHAIQKAAKKAKTFTVTSAAQLNNVQNANYFSLVKQEPGYSDFTSGQQGDATRSRNQTKSIKFLVKDWGSCVESDCGLTSGYVDDDHPKDIMMQMFDMWKEQKMCDAAFIVQGTKVPFHRLMMSACSSHMKTVLDREDLTSSVDIQMPDSVSIEAMYCFLHYIYTGSLSLTINTAQAVLKIATILRVIKVQHHCKQYIENIAGKLGLNPTPTQPVRFTVSREEEAVVGRSGDRRTVVIPDPASEPAGDLPRNFCSESGTVSLETHCDRVADAGDGRSVSDHVNVMDTAGVDFSSSDTSLFTCMKNRASLPANMISQRHCMASNFTVSGGRQFCHLEQPGQNSPSSAEVCQSDCYHGNTGPSSICSGQWSSKMTDSGVQGSLCVEEGEETDMVGSDTETFIKQEPGHDSDLEPCVFFEEQP